MLVKLTPDVNFINVQCTAFALVAPKSIRIQSSCQYHFTLLGSTGAKAAHRTLVKLTPGAFACGETSAVAKSTESKRKSEKIEMYKIFIFILP